MIANLLFKILILNKKKNKKKLNFCLKKLFIQFYIFLNLNRTKEVKNELFVKILTISLFKKNLLSAKDINLNDKVLEIFQFLINIFILKRKN